MCILTTLVISGCLYSEGDEKAEKSFSLMTTQEKAMHDKVSDGFTEKYVMSVRQAVFNREIRPDENTTPFIDIANIIKFVNENILIPPDTWTSSNIEKAMKSKFSVQDGKWYKKIVRIAASSEIESNEALPIKIKEVEVKKALERIESNIVKRVEVNKSDLLPLDKYGDVKFLARGCENAISIIESAASRDRPLTEEDFQKIQYESAVCETKKLNENL